MNTINICFDQEPSAIYTLWKAFRSRNSRYVPSKEYLIIHASRREFPIDMKHLNDFHSICGVVRLPQLHMLYPFTLVYPYIMRVLCNDEIPVSMFKTLNTRNSIIMHRPIMPDERLEIDCRSSQPRITAKGLEIDVHSSVQSRGEKVWENTTTYFYPGKFGPAGESSCTHKIEPLKDGAAIDQWHLQAKDRFRFARISGDTNGIHYWYYYARMMGFKRDFAQPIRIVTRCVSSIPDIEWARPVRLDFYLKGPVYYNSTLTLKNAVVNCKNRFDLFCSGNDKPVISGILHNV